MADEKIIFKGNPSPVAIFGTLLLCAILFIGMSIALVVFWKDLPPGLVQKVVSCLPMIPLFIFFGKWLGLNFITYEITSERIKVIRGIFGKRTDELELYRVKDTTLVEPFIYRIFSAGNIDIVTNDASTPTVELRAIKNAKEVREQLRTSVEECRTSKRTGIVELE